MIFHWFSVSFYKRFTDFKQISTLILTLTFTSEQKLKFSTIVYIKITFLNRIYDKFDNN